MIIILTSLLFLRHTILLGYRFTNKLKRVTTPRTFNQLLHESCARVKISS